MKPKNTNPTEKKQKQTKQQQNKIDEKPKEKKLVSSSSTKDKANIQAQYPNQLNQKQKKNNNLTDSKSPKKIDQNQQKEKNNERKRVLSVSQEKDRNNKSNISKKNDVKTKKGRNLSMEKVPNTYQEGVKSPTNLKVYQDNKKNKKKKEEEKVDPFIQNYDPNLYGFNLYKHIKENFRNKDKLCKDALTKESLYCIDCKTSTCNKCLLNHVHKGHNLIPKYIYYDPDDKIYSDTFNDIDTIFNENPEYLDNQKLKEELKKAVTININLLTKRLNEIKSKKLKELDELFNLTEGCIKDLNEKKEKLKKDLKAYLKKQKDFYYIQVKDENDENLTKKDPDFDPLKSIENENDNLETHSNNDSFNSIFLISYDLFKNTSFINGEIVKLIRNINENRNKYLNEFNENINQIKEDIEKLAKPFKGEFDYSDLNTDFYKMVNDKLDKYNEKIDSMKKYIYDMTNKDGNYDAIDKDIRVSEASIKQNFDNIINFQMADDPTKNLKGKKDTLHRLSLYMNNSMSSDKLQNTIKTMSNSSKDKKGKMRESKLRGIYGSPDEVKLDKDILQRFSAYETYNTVHNHFKYKKPKKKTEEVIEERLFDDEIDKVKPLPGTNEVQLFDKKSTTLTRKKVEFKKKHKYMTFLNGCRYVLIKDMLYIFGGVDKENNPTTIAYVYYIKTNELKLMPEMPKPHSYHSVEYLDFYKSIIVLGGENSATCEIYDLNTGNWKELPDMNIPRAHCNLYLDKFTHVLYAFFGIVGDITDKNNYTDVIECLELKRLSLGWSVIDYENKAEMDFKSGFNKILPISSEMILIYGATNTRDFIKKAAIYLIPKFEIVKIDKRIFKDLGNHDSLRTRKLSKILTSYL